MNFTHDHGAGTNSDYSHKITICGVHTMWPGTARSTGRGLFYLHGFPSKTGDGRGFLMKIRPGKETDFVFAP